LKFFGDNDGFIQLYGIEYAAKNFNISNDEKFAITFAGYNKEKKDDNNNTTVGKEVNHIIIFNYRMCSFGIF
jgi:hypothetical protein